jgi:MFS family permease
LPGRRATTYQRSWPTTSPPPPAFQAPGCSVASRLLAALLGPPVGKWIDRRGGAGVLVTSNVVLAVGLLTLSASHGIGSLALAWGLMGIGMAFGLYDAIRLLPIMRVIGGNELSLSLISEASCAELAARRRRYKGAKKLENELSSPVRQGISE